MGSSTNRGFPGSLLPSFLSARLNAPQVLRSTLPAFHLRDTRGRAPLGPRQSAFPQEIRSAVDQHLHVLDVVRSRGEHERRLPRSFGPVDRRARVDEALNDLGAASFRRELDGRISKRLSTVCTSCPPQAVLGLPGALAPDPGPEQVFRSREDTTRNRRWGDTPARRQRSTQSKCALRRFVLWDYAPTGWPPAAVRGCSGGGIRLPPSSRPPASS
jgi:hypothetical protein